MSASQAWTDFLNATLAEDSASDVLATPLAEGSCRFFSSSVMKFVGAVQQRIAALLTPEKAKAMGIHPDCLEKVPPPPPPVRRPTGSEQAAPLRSATEPHRLLSFDLVSSRAAVGAHLCSSRARPRLASCAPPQPDSPEANKRAAVGPSGVVLMDPQQLRRFLKRCCEVFLHHDVAQSLNVLLLRSTGSFGITCISAQARRGAAFFCTVRRVAKE